MFIGFTLEGCLVIIVNVVLSIAQFNLDAHLNIFFLDFLLLLSHYFIVCSRVLPVILLPIIVIIYMFINITIYYI